MIKDKIFKVGKNRFIVNLSKSNVMRTGADNSIYASNKYVKVIENNSNNIISFTNNTRFEISNIKYMVNINPHGQNQLKIIESGRFSGNFPVKYLDNLEHRFMMFDFENDRNYLIPVNDISSYILQEEDIHFEEPMYINEMKKMYAGEELKASYIESYPTYLKSMQDEFGPLNFNTIDKVIRSQRYVEVNSKHNNVWSASLAQYVKMLQNRFGGFNMKNKEEEVIMIAEHEGKNTIKDVEENELVISEIADFTEVDYKQLIIDGAPGTGKSYGVNTEVKENNINHERVTFYSDYEYHNFIGSILPKLNGETVTYEFVKGPFTKILNDALSQPEDKHYLIVEELTRGNAAAIFGDIFQLLDRTEEGWSEYPITHNNILESLDPEVRTFLENEYEGKVVLPPNLSIICTINSSDQNVYPLDTAFKRRFDYKIESTNVHSNFVDYDIKFGTDIKVSWQDFYQKLNKYILVDLGLKEDKQVGPYFIKNHKDDNKKLESIQTKLAMYMWNDLHKVHTISNKTIFKDVHTLYEVDNLFRTGSREQILNVLSTEFKQHFKLNDSSEQ